MSMSSSAVRRRSFKLHKAILGTSLALASVGVSLPKAANAQFLNAGGVVTVPGGGNLLNITNITANADGTGGAVGPDLTGTATALGLNGKTLTFNAAANALAAQLASIGGTGTIDINANNQATTAVFTGAGTITLSNGGAAATYQTNGNNNFTGTVTTGNNVTFIVNGTDTGAGTYATTGAGNLTVNAAGVLSNNAIVNLAGTGTFTLNNTNTIAQIDSAAGNTITLTNSILTFGGNNVNSTIAGTVGGNGGLTKAGTGTTTISAATTFTGATTINGGTLALGANNVLSTSSGVQVNNAATLDLGGFTTSLTLSTAPGSTVSNGTLAGTVNAQGGTFNNVAGAAALNVNSGATTLTGTNSFGNIALNNGTLTVSVPTTGTTTPLTTTGTLSAGGGLLDLDASGLTKAQVEGDKTIVAGTVADSVAASTTFTFDGRTERFAGFDKPLEGVGLYDIQLKKGSVILSVQRKGADDICGVTGLCTTGEAQGKLEGLDRTEVKSLYGKVVLPALESGRLDLPFWTTNNQISKYLISGLMPRNIDAAGTVLSSYNDRMADTLFERLPLRQFDPIDVVEEEIVIEEVETEPVRGLWKTTAEGEVLEVNGQTYKENPSLIAQYADRENMRAWVRGFGGDVASANTTKYLYKDYNATNAGGVVGVDYAVFNDFQVGLYANYGDLAINTDGNKYAGSGSWNPTGWGGGITADYWTDSYYLQGLFGASAFSGDQDRSIVAIGGNLGGGNTLSGNKNITSYVGALRAGAPMQIGSFYLEPQAQATWSGNQEDAFNEGGNSNFKLKYKSRETNFLQTELGFKLAYPIALGSTQQLVPSIRLAWLGDWNMDNQGQKIGYRFSNKTIDLQSNQQDQNGALLEGGLDYTVANIGATSFKVYGRGGAEVWDTERGTNWRASGGVTVQF